MFNFLFQGKVGDMMAPIKSPEAQLLIAIQNRQLDKVHELLEVQNVGANNANDRGVRPMHMACQTGNMALVQRLLELGANITSADKAGNTPLHYAAKGGHPEMVKMLVSQGAGPEKRNAARQTAYEVATDHIIRQFLLPLQLKAEAGNPEYAVHGMGITSDAPRNYEQYGVPSMSQQQHSQPYGHPSSGADPLSAALGALMQAPGMGPPRPGGGSIGMPPTPYGGNYAGTTPPRHAGSFSPPQAGAGGGGAPGYPAQQPTLPTPAAVGSLSPATPQAAQSLPTPFSGAPAGPAALVLASSPLPTPTPGRGSGASAIQGSETPPRTASAAAANPSPEVSGPSFPGVAIQVQPAAALGSPPTAPPVEGTAAGAEVAGGSGIRVGEAVGPTSLAQESKTDASSAGFALDGGNVTDMSEDAQSSTQPPGSDLRLGAAVAQPFAGVPVHTQQEDEGEAKSEPLRPVEPSSLAVAPGGMTNVDLSSTFQNQAVISGAEGPFVGGIGGGIGEVGAAGATPNAPPTQPSSAPSSGHGAAPLPTRPPPGAYMPGPGPQQGTVEQPKKFKLIKPDGFHSSASDKNLQLRYGHTKITRDMGAPPTFAQLSGPPGGGAAGGGMGSGGASYGAPMARPSMGGPPNSGGYAPSTHAPSPYAMPPQHQQQHHGGHYGQPFGAVGGSGGGGMHQSYGNQGYGVQQPSTAQAYAPPPANSHAVEGNPYPTYGGGPAPPPQAAPSGSGGVVGGFSVFNPTTDRVVAADSTSNAVL